MLYNFDIVNIVILILNHIEFMSGGLFDSDADEFKGHTHATSSKRE